MITEKESKRISKFLSFILRHNPQQIGLELDTNGWADVNSLIEKCSLANIPLTLDILKHIVETNSKKRFAFNENETRIRASQGHSIEVELALKPIKPPSVLYHGTAARFVPSILENGLTKQQRQHVHLSLNIETAIDVGRRHGKPVVFEIAAQQMFEDNYQFFLSDNGVWLTGNVLPKYLKELVAGVSSPKQQ
jgi:putative RNA 2'-phosphotransferase